MSALYREDAGWDWYDVEIVARRSDGYFIVREVGRLLPGVWLASIDQLRVAA